MSIREPWLTSIRRYVLEQILSGENTENVIEHIHEYLTTMGEDVRAGKIKPDEFIIFKVGHSCIPCKRISLTP